MSCSPSSTWVSRCAHRAFALAVPANLDLNESTAPCLGLRRSRRGARLSGPNLQCYTAATSSAWRVRRVSTDVPPSYDNAVSSRTASALPLLQLLACTSLGHPRCGGASCWPAWTSLALFPLHERTQRRRPQIRSPSREPRSRQHAVKQSPTRALPPSMVYLA